MNMYAVVTGGTRGIGKQICIDLLKKGYFIITNYVHNDNEAEVARKEFSKYSNLFEVIKIDQSKESDIKSFVQFIISKANEIHCIVCNTGSTLKKDFDKVTNQEWETIFMINLHSHFYLIRDLKSYIQNKSKIIFIGSLLGDVPHSTSLGYGVAKAALNALAKNLVKEFSEMEVTVNTIAPGFVDTDWQKDKSFEIRENIYKKTAIKRFATVEEISKVCMMILENDFINGATIPVDGGYNYR